MNIIDELKNGKTLTIGWGVHKQKLYFENGMFYEDLDDGDCWKRKPRTEDYIAYNINHIKNNRDAYHISIK